jgi:hypothetical protein
MKSLLCLLALVTSPCFACDFTDMATLRMDVEAAFESRSLTQLVERYSAPGPVQVRVQNFYDDDFPLQIRDFGDLAALAAWFDETHESAPVMFVPEKAYCDEFECLYDLPDETLHHGIYLLGFESLLHKDCRVLREVSISWE